jgi:predicted enzyme involved in methoxymalonyl-ACP biosynthesis
LSCSTCLIRSYTRIHVPAKCLINDLDNLLLMGIIIVDGIMVLHLIFSVMSTSKKSLVGC